MRSNSILGLWLSSLATTLASPQPQLASLIESRSSTLNWKPCNLDLSSDVKAAMREQGYCATLEVPLDYTNLDSGKTVELQLIRFNATKEPFKGSVLWNPGGPGISGIETFATLGPDFRDIIGGHHHAISFDPRGVGRTIPFSCRPSNTPVKVTRRGDSTLPQADLWSYVKTQKWAENSAIADACYSTQQEYGRYINTAFTARDMTKIVDALGEDGKLRYWGISYGTVLGQVFASMFPDRIGRLLLDSNTLADPYLTSTGIGGSRDAEKSLMYLFSECVKVRHKTCKLANYAGHRTTVQDLRDAIEELFQKLTEMPNVPAGSGLSKEEYPYGGKSMLQRLKLLIIDGLSSPGGYPKVAELLLHALNGRWKKALRTEQAATSEWNRGTEAFAGIACLDSSFRAKNPDDLYSMYRAHLAESSFGDAIAVEYLGCGSWRFEAPEKIDTDKLRSINTSFPVLVINGAYDPVTPLSHAFQVSSRFRESHMLVHEGVGHGVTYHASNCTLNAIASYFRDGTLPEIGAVCKPNMLAFEAAKLFA